MKHCRFRLTLILSLSLSAGIACSDRGSSTPILPGMTDVESDSSGPDNDVAQTPDTAVADDADSDGAEVLATPDIGELLDEPVELLGFARLSASTTRRAFLWVREDQDAVATVRDDDPDTSFKPVDEEATSVCIDFQPWARRSVLLDSIAVVASASAFPIAVLIGPNCDPAAAQEVGAIAASADSLAFAAGTYAGTLILELPAGTGISLNEISVLSSDPLAVGEVSERASARTHPGGAIEGFYGVVWSWQERAAMLRTLAAFDLQSYVYAPKLDPLHRDDWRGAYGEDFLRQFGALSELGEELNIDVLFGLSPFIDYDDERDYETLRIKLERFADFGLLGVVLLADDIEDGVGRPVDGVLGALHAEVANRLFDDLRESRPELELFFVPTVYSDDRLGRWPGGPAYLQALTALDPEIEFMWTGLNTSTLEMKPEDMDTVRSYVERLPLIWDNFWANDGGNGFQGRILLAPFEGRSPELLDSVSGILHNPSVQGGLSRLAMGTFGAWFDEPASGPVVLRTVAAQAELTNALHREADDDFVRTLTDVMSVFDGHAQRDTAYAAFADAINVFRSDSPTSFEVADALRAFATMATLQSSLYHSAAPADIADELVYPLDKVRLDGLAALFRVTEIRERRSGRQDSAASAGAEALALEQASSESRFTYSDGQPGRLSGFAALVAAEPSATQEPWELAPLPTSASLDSVLNIDTDDSEYELFGLPGAVRSGTGFQWSPPHAGSYDCVLTGVRVVDGLTSWTWTRAQIRVR
jgi:hypothetical protein